MLCVGGGSVRSIFYYTSGGREKSMLLGCECRRGRTMLRRRRRPPYNLYFVGGDVKHCSIQSNRRRRHHTRNGRSLAVSYHVVYLWAVSLTTQRTQRKYATQDLALRTLRSYGNRYLSPITITKTSQKSKQNEFLPPAVA